MKKSEVITILNTLPDEFSIDEIVEKMYLVEGINKSIEQINEGNTFTQEEVEEMFRNKWQTY